MWRVRASKFFYIFTLIYSFYAYVFCRFCHVTFMKKFCLIAQIFIIHIRNEHTHRLLHSIESKDISLTYTVYSHVTLFRITSPVDSLRHLLSEWGKRALIFGYNIMQWCVIGTWFNIYPALISWRQLHHMRSDTLFLNLQDFSGQMKIEKWCNIISKTLAKVLGWAKFCRWENSKPIIDSKE